jgi:hypothetical protein
MLNNEENIVLYLIESGPMLDLVKHHIAERDRSRNAKVSILAQLGLNPEKVQIWSHAYDGGMTGVQIPRGLKMPPAFVASNWTKPDSQGRSRPKKGTDEYKIFYDKEATYLPAEQLIAENLKVPCSIGYKEGGGEGWTRIGRMLSSCGFLWLHRDTGPYALWLPDVAACIVELRAQYKGSKSFKILGGVDKWVLDTTGLKPLMQEEWDLMVAEHNLKQARAKQVAEQQEAA